MSEDAHSKDSKFTDDDPETVELDYQELDQINELLAQAMNKANISNDKPIRTSRAIALNKTEEAHHRLSNLLPGWHSTEEVDDGE